MTPDQMIITQLRKTLRPDQIQQATRYLQQVRSCIGFTKNLILITDNQNLQLPLKISALVYLKNIIQEQCKNPNIIIIDAQDLNIVKQSILQVLIKIIHKNQSKLLPTIKYILFLFAKYHFKQSKWPGLIPQLLINLDSCSSFQSIKGTLILVKILFQILGKSITEQIKLNNLANKVILPLVNLASKMYADLSIFSCISLEQIFKILTQSIQFHLPQVIQKNIHIFMVLVKNVLDLKTNSPIASQKGHEHLMRILRIKRQALIFLQKMYQRHSTSNLTSLQSFVIQFNQKYTKPYFQTIVGIIMSQNIRGQNLSHQIYQKISGINFDLINHALGIFSFITGNRQSEKCIKQELQRYQLKILYLSMEKFLRCHSDKLQDKIRRAGKKQQEFYQNYSDFVQTFREERQCLRLFLSMIFSNKNIQNRHKSIEDILQLLLKCIVQGSFKQKQLALYLLASLQRDIQLLNQQTFQNLNQKMLTLLSLYILPLLTIKPQEFPSQDSFFLHLVKLRAYEIYARYQYLQIGRQQSTKICEIAYQELLTTSSTQIQLFVKVQVIQTFNTFLASDNSLIPKVQSSIPQILRIYTHLLTKEFEVMKYYQEILSLFSQYISPIVYELLQLLTDMFFKITEQKKMKFNSLSGQKYNMTNKKHDQIQEDECLTFNQDQDTQESEDDQTIYEDIQHKYENIGTQCLASIKKLIFKHAINSHEYASSTKLQQKLIIVILEGIASQDETFIKQSLSILNLLLYKNFVCVEYHLIMPALIYPILISKNHDVCGQIQKYIHSSQQSKSQTLGSFQVMFGKLYRKVLKFIIKDPYSRVFSVFEQIGCLKNLIKVLGKSLYTLKCPILNKAYLQILIQGVIYVQQADESQNYSRSQVLSMVSILEALLEQRIFQIGHSDSNQSRVNFKQDPYFQVSVQKVIKWSHFIEKSHFQYDFIERLKTFYLRINLLAVYAYPFQFFKCFQTQLIGQINILPNSADYPAEKVVNQMGLLIVQKIAQQIKLESELKEPNLHLLNDSFVFLKGMVSLGQILMSNFVTTDGNNFERSSSIARNLEPLLSKIFYSIIRLSLQVVQLVARQYYGQKCPDVISIAKRDMLKDDLYSKEYRQNVFNQREKQQFGQESQMLIKMLKNLSVQAASETAVNKPAHQSSGENKPARFQVQYQQHLNKSELLVEESFFSSQGSQDGSNVSSLPDNPFQSSDQQYLYAYDSPMFGGIFTQNKKKQLKTIIEELIQVYMSQKMYYLREFVQGKI